MRPARAAAYVAIIALCLMSGHEGSAAQPAARPTAQAAAQPAAQPAAQAARVLRVRRAQLMDAQIFGRPSEVLAMMIPADWSFRGSLTVDYAVFQWCPENAFTPALQAESPDRTVGYALYPALQTIHFNHPILAEDARRRQQAGQGFCAQQPPMDLPTYVAQVFIPSYHPQARVLRVAPAPQLQQSVRQQLAEMRLPPNMQVSGDAAEVVIGYSIDGKPVEEHVFVIGGWRGEGAFGQPSADLIYSTYTPIFGLRAPAGQFDRHKQQFTDIIASTRANTHYYAAIIDAIQAQRMNIFNNFIDDIRRTSAIWRKAWESSNEASKRSEAEKSTRKGYDVAGAWSDTTLDVQNYKDANGETVQLSGGYNHVFSNGNGEYIQTNDSSYNPAVATGSRWEPIEAIPR